MAPGDKLVVYDARDVLARLPPSQLLRLCDGVLLASLKTLGTMPLFGFVPRFVGWRDGIEGRWNIEQSGLDGGENANRTE